MLLGLTHIYEGRLLYLFDFLKWVHLIPVEMEDPFTRMSQNFFSFLSQIKQRGYVIATTQALSFSFFPPFSTTLVCVCSTVLLEFPNHPQEFPNLPTPMRDLGTRRHQHFNVLQKRHSLPYKKCFFSILST